MGSSIQPSVSRLAWALARRQHWVVSRSQLLELGFHPKAIEHRVATGRLHPVHAGVYAVGRRELSREGTWMAAVLACGPDAFLSHWAAGALWGFIDWKPRAIDVSLRTRSCRRRPGLAVHRRPSLPAAEIGRYRGVPVTRPVRTLLDIATLLQGRRLEAAVNEADKLDLVDPEELRAAVAERAGQPGTRPLRALLDRRAFRLTDSELERRFLAIARGAGLAMPETQVWVNGFRVDFFWPALGLVVETDGLRYHRTPATQSRDARRDQDHVAAGLTVLRFTHEQVRYEPRATGLNLAKVAARLA